MSSQAVIRSPIHQQRSSPVGPSLTDLAERFGAIPARRLRLERFPGTEEDVIDFRERDQVRCELVDGILVEKAMGYLEGQVACVLIELLRQFVVPRKLGVVNGPDGMMKLSPGLIRIPDVSFVAWAQFPGGKIPRTPIPSIHPDLAVEVLSRGNTVEEMDAKHRDYFAHGTPLVWLVDAEARTIAVYDAAHPNSPQILKESETIGGEPVLSGFSFPVAKLFEELG